MHTVLANVQLASLPAEYLPLLAELRCHSGVVVQTGRERCWVQWRPADSGVLRVLLPVPGVHLYRQRQGQWYRAGHELPAFEVPQNLDGRPLAAVLVPERVEPVIAPPATPPPTVLRLVADFEPRQATACLCTAPQLQRWADTVSSWRLAEVQAARCEGRILLVGPRLPLFAASDDSFSRDAQRSAQRSGAASAPRASPGADATGLTSALHIAARRDATGRFWGATIFVPIGMRPDPFLPESALAAAAGVREDEMLLWHEHGAEVISRNALQPLSRAAIRLLERDHEIAQ